MSELLYARDVYGQTLLELGQMNSNIVVLDADLSQSTRTSKFAMEFPDRFFNVGVAEQNLMAVAAGLASCGKLPFVSTYSVFASGRAWDQIRNSICSNNFNIKIVATHSGVTVGPDGSSHQALEDIALMRTIPNMTIIVPCDGPETKSAVIAAVKYMGPVYIRLGRPKVPTINGKKGFKIGKAYILREGLDVAIIACGIMVKQALVAADMLKKNCIESCVVNMHTIKPLDVAIIYDLARRTKGIIVCEEHSIIGGLASAVAEVSAEYIPTRVVKIGVKDRFGQSGSSQELLREYNLAPSDIVSAARKILN